MELRIKPASKNLFPLKGLLIRSPSVVSWIKEIQLLRLSLSDIQLFAIPGNTANSIWGCLIITAGEINKSSAGRNELCQMVTGDLFIPEKSVLFPALKTTEIEKLFLTTHLLHPDFGAVELGEEVNLSQLLVAPRQQPVAITMPQPTLVVPKTIRSFQVVSVSPEDVLKNLSEHIFPQQEKMKDEPLSLGEKIRLGFYRMLFTKKEGEGKSPSLEKTSLGTTLERFFDNLFKSGKGLQRIQEDFEDLDKRNQKEVDKLMDLLKNNPEEALKYAIPLDEGGATRGGEASRLDMSKRWFDFSLFDNRDRSSGSGTINLGDNFQRLQNQYTLTAEELIKRGEYQKAAFVYMKLLKNYHKAAEALEQGKFYKEAATIYFKHAGNKMKAAECYEKGNMTLDAIDIYKSMSNHEKVGDLYIILSRKREAMHYYLKEVDERKSRNQYVKASELYKGKMNDFSAGQSLLLEGWKGNVDAAGCIKKYFSDIDDVDELGKEIQRLYSNEVKMENSISFLHALQQQYKSRKQLQEPLKDMAYEIVAMQIPSNPAIVSELKDFGPNNKELLKDTLRFKLNVKSRDAKKSK